MNLDRILVILFALQTLALTVFAQDQNMAVIDVQLQGEAKKFFSPEEKMYLSQAIRAQASQILGGSVNILSQASYKKLVRANSEGCSEAGCFAGFLAEIGVDLGVQPNVSFAFGKLKLTLEVADKRATIASRTLSAPATAEGKNKLGEDAEVIAKELFTEVAARMGVLQSGAVEKRASWTPDPTPDEVGTNLTIEFTDGPGAILFDSKLACSSKERCSKEVGNGMHTITASRDGYRDSAFTVTVPKGSNRYALALVSKAGILTIRVTDFEGSPITAQVLVDGRAVGNTPWSGAVPITANSIVLHADGYADAVVRDRPDEGKKKTVNVTLDSDKSQASKTLATGCSADGCVGIQPIEDNATLDGVNFLTGTFRLTFESKKVLDKIVEQLQAYPKVQIEIRGHSDNVGKQATNQILTEERAKVVVDYFASKGVDMKRMAWAGFGDTRPIEDNRTAAGRAKNRRIEMYRTR
jgi:outer membrane protein OmpA-like peptidoglycan-associated protein